MAHHNHHTPKPDWWTMFEDNTGGFSMTRVILMIITVIVLLTWTTACYRSKTIVPLPDNAVMLIVGFGGVKAVQRFGEKGPEYSVNMDSDSSTSAPQPGVAPIQSPVIIAPTVAAVPPQPPVVPPVVAPTGPVVSNSATLP